METDIHTHTRFSDGSALSAMIEAAEQAGLGGIGLTDHCILTDDDFGRHEQFDLDDTYDQRRKQIEAAREQTDLRVYDAVEMSYVADDTGRIESFLTTADFEYTIGSAHFAAGYDYTTDAQYVDATDEQRRHVVACYYDALVELIDSELFDIVAHVDLPERLDTLRGYSRRHDYDRVAAALADSRTVPEINAGRVTGSLGRPHPNPDLLSQFTERGVAFVLGTDSHTPDEITTRVPKLREFVDHSGINVCDMGDLL